MNETKPSARRDAPSGRKRGRPAKVGTRVLTVRITEQVHDAYIRTAHRAGEDVRTITARVLTYHVAEPMNAFQGRVGGNGPS